MRVTLADVNDVPTPETGTNGAIAKESLRLATLEEFVSVEEEGAGALVGVRDAAVIPEGGEVMFYGDGGAGKTTLAIDLACHLAAGDDWLGMLVQRPAKVLLVENEGPRALFRAKLRRKRDGWQGSDLAERIRVLERPWGEFSFAEEPWRATLAEAVMSLELDVLMVGPVTRSGMNEAGTLQEVRDFMALVGELRRRSERLLTVLLIHHENKGGQVSGAWEGAGDTLCHIQGQGHGRTRLYFQKARWASEQHGTALNLLWADGEGFTVDEKPDLDDEAIAEMIVATVRDNPGTGWMKVEAAVKGTGKDQIRAVRDGLLAAGTIVNVDGDEIRELQERRAAHLYDAEDPTIKHLRLASAAAPPQARPLWGAEPVSAGSQALRRAAALKEPHAWAADAAPPIDDPERGAEATVDEEDVF